MNERRANDLATDDQLLDLEGNRRTNPPALGTVFQGEAPPSAADEKTDQPETMGRRHDNQPDVRPEEAEFSTGPGAGGD